MLAVNDAVAAIITLEDGRFLMQLRDDKPDIWYPGYWGCFGGAVDRGETPEQALKRELFEELEFNIREATYLTRFDFDFKSFGMQYCYRIYYVVKMTERESRALKLHEGRSVEAFNYEVLTGSKHVTPYDSFALHLFRQLSQKRPS